MKKRNITFFSARPSFHVFIIHLFPDAATHLTSSPRPLHVVVRRCLKMPAFRFRRFCHSAYPENLISSLPFPSLRRAPEQRAAVSLVPSSSSSLAEWNSVVLSSQEREQERQSLSLGAASRTMECRGCRPNKGELPKTPNDGGPIQRG